MPVSAYFFVAVLIAAVVVVFRMSLSNRIGGEPRRRWFRRAVPTTPPNDSPTDPFAGGRPLDTDPNMAALRAGANATMNRVAPKQ